MSRDGNDYEIGYGKPPKSTQFQKGQSGNPNGRPPGTRKDGMLRMSHKELRDIVMDEAFMDIDLIENGRKIRISKFRCVLRQLANKAIKGHTPSAKHLHKTVEAIVQNEEMIMRAYIDAEERKRIQRMDDLQGAVEKETAPSQLQIMEFLHKFFSDRKQCRFALGETEVPYMELEPRTHEDWIKLEEHILDVRNSVESPRPWFDISDEDIQNSEIMQEIREKEMARNPEFREIIENLEAKRAAKELQDDSEECGSEERV